MAFETHGQAEDSGDRLYTIRAELDYKLLQNGQVLSAGRGETAMMSSSRVVFESETGLPPGILVELSVTWPVRLAEGVGLVLNVFGRIVRTSGNSVTLDILRHEFRRIAVSDAASLGTNAKAMAAGSAITAYHSQQAETGTDASEPEKPLKAERLPRPARV